MPDWVIGQAPQPVLTDDGAGNTRITYAPWELDWEWFNTITVGVHFMANITAAATSLVTAKGGTERTGYFFDIGLAIGTWAAGDRIAPVRDAGLSQNNTMAAGFAAMANLDTALVWYADTADRRFWYDRVTNASNTKAIDVWGMLSKKQISFHPGNNTYWWRAEGALVGTFTRQMIVRNLDFAPGRVANPVTIRYRDTGVGGQGILMDRCRQHSGYIMFHVVSGTVNVCELRNSQGINLDTAVIFTSVAAIANFSTGIGGNFIFQASAQASTFRNCLGLWSNGDVFRNVGGATLTTCGSSDATGSPGLQGLTAANVDLWLDEDYGNFGLDSRIRDTATIVGAGTAVVGITVDTDGNTRATPPTVGASEGVLKPYLNYIPPVPAGFAAANPATDGDLTFTWTNGAAYLSLDEVVIYNNATGLEIGRGLASLGTLTISGIPNGVAFTAFGRGLSDNGPESANSVLGTATPTAGAGGVRHAVVSTKIPWST